MKIRARVLAVLLPAVTAGCSEQDLNELFGEPDAATTLQDDSGVIPTAGAGGTTQTSLPGGAGGGGTIPSMGGGAGADAGAGGAGGATTVLRDATVGDLASPAADPCRGVPPEGRCILGENAWEVCATPTGNGEPELLRLDCSENEVCVEGEYGADCMAHAGTCNEGASRCAGTQLQECVGGSWSTTDCPTGCRQTALKAFCPDPVPTATYQGTMTYQARGPNADYSDWASTVSTYPARGVLVISARGDSFVDATLTAEDGTFTVKVPSPFKSGDIIRVLLLSPNADQTAVAFSLVDPRLPDGVQDERVTTLGVNAMIWQWSIDPGATPSGSTLTITEEIGSGAVRVYDYLRYIYLSTWTQYAAPGPALAILLGMNTAWNCGACFMPLPTKIGPLDFKAQILIPATATDTSYWSDAVTAHELGHWVMHAYGTLPGEGGPHALAVPTLPGQAWSEGWATGFSALMRADSRYFDKQRGSMFWFDLGQRRYSRGIWTRPDPSGGLMQKMDENEVAAMLWELGQADKATRATVLTTLASPRVRQSPFARGYTRRIWEVDAGYNQVNVFNTGMPAPMFADYLDALVCSGVSAAVIDAVTDPTTNYPYPSDAPLCE